MRKDVRISEHGSDNLKGFFFFFLNSHSFIRLGCL
jgi:hypothetical protein